MKFDFKLAGVEDLAALFDQLPRAVGKQVLTRALAKAGLPVAIAARAMAARSSGPGPHLADGIAIGTQLTRTQRRQAPPAGGVTVFVGARTPNAHLVEFGTGPRFTRSGRYAGRMPAKPFLRPAWDTNKGRVLEILKAELWAELLKAARRLRKRATKLAKALGR